MLPLSGLLKPTQPGTFTNHKMFVSKPSHRAPTTCPPVPGPSSSHKVVRKNSGVNSKGEGEDDSHSEGGGDGSHVPTTLPPLLANASLREAVSETMMAAWIKEWGMSENLSEVFK